MTYYNFKNKEFEGFKKFLINEGFVYCDEFNERLACDCLVFKKGMRNVYLFKETNGFFIYLKNKDLLDAYFLSVGELSEQGHRYLVWSKANDIIDKLSKSTRTAEDDEIINSINDLEVAKAVIKQMGNL